MLISITLMLVFYGYAYYAYISEKLVVTAPLGLERLSEQSAIDITRNILDLSGKDQYKLDPFPYTDNSQTYERIFARNSDDPNSGYVIWNCSEPDCSNRPGYTVRIKLKEGKIYAELSKGK